MRRVTGGRIVLSSTYISVALKSIWHNVHCLHFLPASLGEGPLSCSQLKMESCPFKQPHKVKKGEAGKEEEILWGGERGWLVCASVHSWLLRVGGGVTSWEAPDEPRNGVSLLISKLKHVPRWGRAQMSDRDCKAARHQGGTLLIFLTFKWVTPIWAALEKNEKTSCFSH